MCALGAKKSPPELVASTGAGKSAGLTTFRVSDPLEARLDAKEGLSLSERTDLAADKRTCHALSPPPQRNLYLTRRRPLHLPSSASVVGETEAETKAAFMPTVGLWRLQLAPAVDATKQELWIASDKEQTLVSRMSA